MCKESLDERLQIIDLRVNGWYQFDIQGRDLILHMCKEISGSESHIDAVIVAAAKLTVWPRLYFLLLLAVVLQNSGFLAVRQLDHLLCLLLLLRLLEPVFLWISAVGFVEVLQTILNSLPRQQWEVSQLDLV